MSGTLPPVVFSVGHGARTVEAFLALLLGEGVAVLADVRRFPRSRRHPHFSEGALDRSCAAAGIERVALGDDLGGFRAGSYEEHLVTPELARGLARLEALARARPTAFCCAESRPEHCHRRFLAEELERRGFRVRHLLEPGRDAEPPAQLALFSG